MSLEPPPGLAWIHELPDLPGAACAQIGVGDAPWFPELGERSKAARAKQVCRACPALNDCFTYAMDNPGLDGIWAATTAKDRQQLRSVARRRAAA